MSGVDLPVADLTTQTGIPCDVFSRAQIQTNPLGGNVIAWGLQEGFLKRAPFNFYVDFGRAGTNEWEALNQVPIVDNCMFVDPCQRHWDNQVDYYYRVRVVLPNEHTDDGDCVSYVSQPQLANGLWTRDDWLLAREIVRKELLMQTKRTNRSSPGLLLKRKRFGTKYEPVTEFDTGEQQHTHSNVDYGVGFIGGYYPGIDFIVTMDAPWTRQIKLDETVSVRRDITRNGRAVAYPYVETGDVFLRRDNGERYFVWGVTTITEVGGIPLIQSLELRLVPVTNIIYEVPTEGEASSQSSSQSSSGQTSCDWRTGLNTDVSW